MSVEYVGHPIERFQDLLPGDIATFAHMGNEWSGELWVHPLDAGKPVGEYLMLGATRVIFAGSITAASSTTFVSAYRRTPLLPTETGAVIEAKDELGQIVIACRARGEQTPNGWRPEWSCVWADGSHGFLSGRSLTLVRVLHDAGAAS